MIRPAKRSAIRSILAVVILSATVLSGCQGIPSTGPAIGVIQATAAPTSAPDPEDAVSDEAKKYMDDVKKQMNSSLKDLEEIVGPGGSDCYMDDTTVVLDYWVDDTKTLLDGYYAGITVDGVTHFDALTSIGGVMAQYHNAMEEYGLDPDKNDFIVKLLYDGKKDVVLIYWVNGELTGNALTGYEP